MAWVTRALRHNGLGLFFLAIFLASLVGLAIAGHAAYNEDEITHARLLHEAPETISLGRYVTSSSFWQAVMENWQSEYLQFVLFILATIWLVQRGSAESGELDTVGLEDDAQQRLGDHAEPDSPGPAKRRGGVMRRLYENSLLIVMGLIFMCSWFAQSVTGWSEYSALQIQHRQPGISWLDYLQTGDFWETTLQNWQSEFLAIGSVVIFTVLLRQRGSHQSKPVGAPHAETGSEG